MQSVIPHTAGDALLTRHPQSQDREESAELLGLGWCIQCQRDKLSLNKLRWSVHHSPTTVVTQIRTLNLSYYTNVSGDESSIQTHAVFQTS